MSALKRVNTSELGAEQNDLRRIIHPEKQDHDGTGGPVGRRRSGVREIEADEGIAKHKQNGRDRRPDPHIPPGNACILSSDNYFSRSCCLI